MVSKLTFKNEKKSSKKRKHEADTTETSLSHSKIATDTKSAAEEADDDQGWATAESRDDLNGPCMLVLVIRSGIVY